MAEAPWVAKLCRTEGAGRPVIRRSWSASQRLFLPTQPSTASKTCCMVAPLNV